MCVLIEKCIVCLLGKFECLERDLMEDLVSDQEVLGKVGDLFIQCG